MTPLRRLKKCLYSIGFLLLGAGLHAPKADAQSLAVGAGAGLVLMDYITGQVDRDYRTTPSLGYYPVLKNYQNAFGSFHFSASLILNIELPVHLEIRFDGARMRWKTARVTHVSCTPVELVDGKFNDAMASYVGLNQVDTSCLDAKTYPAAKNIASDAMPSLWWFHISGGMRYSFLKRENWDLFVGAHLGLSIAKYEGTWFGGHADAIVGVMYRISKSIWLEIDAKILFAVTQVPQDSQTRINHETQTGGNIFTSLVQPEAYVDFQASLRFDFSDL